MIISKSEVARVLENLFDDRGAEGQLHSPIHEGAVAVLDGNPLDGSAQSDLVAHARKAYDELPDVRVDRVQALKAQIEAGQYHVSGEDIADLMIRRALADRTSP